MTIKESLKEKYDSAEGDTIKKVIASGEGGTGDTIAKVIKSGGAESGEADSGGGQ